MRLLFEIPFNDNGRPLKKETLLTSVTKWQYWVTIENIHAKLFQWWFYSHLECRQGGKQVVKLSSLSENHQ